MLFGESLAYDGHDECDWRNVRVLLGENFQCVMSVMYVTSLTGMTGDRCGGGCKVKAYDGCKECDRRNLVFVMERKPTVHDVCEECNGCDGCYHVKDYSVCVTSVTGCDGCDGCYGLKAYSV